MADVLTNLIVEIDKGILSVFLNIPSKKNAVNNAVYEVIQYNLLAFYRARESRLNLFLYYVCVRCMCVRLAEVPSY